MMMMMTICETAVIWKSYT